MKRITFVSSQDQSKRTVIMTSSAADLAALTQAAKNKLRLKRPTAFFTEEGLSVTDGAPLHDDQRLLASQGEPFVGASPLTVTVEAVSLPSAARRSPRLAAAAAAPKRQCSSGETSLSQALPATTAPVASAAAEATEGETSTGALHGERFELPGEKGAMCWLAVGGGRLALWHRPGKKSYGKLKAAGCSTVCTLLGAKELKIVWASEFCYCTTTT